MIPFLFLVISSCFAADEAPPILVRDLAPRKWDRGAAVLNADPSRTSVLVSRRFNSMGIMEWEFYLVRVQDHYEELTFKHWKLVKRIIYKIN